MNRTILRKACSGLLAGVLLLSCTILPNAAHAADVKTATPKDVLKHWARASIEKVIAAGIVKGYPDGTFRPETPVTRAEFSHMLNAALGNTGTAVLSFRDVPRSEWHYADVSKAVAAGYVSGYSDTIFGPDNFITREEAAVMLSRLVPTYGYSTSIGKYPDHSTVSSWARSPMERIVGKGYLGTYSDGKLHPQDQMTRAQSAVIIGKMLSKETIVKTDPDVTKSGTILSNTIYSNGVTVNKNLGDGDMTVNNCVVLGTFNVLGGGDNTVVLNNSRVAQATVQKSGSSVRLLAKGDTSVKNTTLANTSSLKTAGLSGDSIYGTGFENISVARNAKASLDGIFPNVDVDGTAAVILTSGQINNLIVSSSARESGITVESGATITTATVNSEAYFHGTGIVSKMIANANGITYEKKPGTIILGSGITKSPTLTDTQLAISPNPANGKTGVAIDTGITITFNSAMKLYNGNAITKTNIKDCVELRRNSSSGTLTDFSASVDSTGKIITLVPTSNLNINTKYYIIISRNTLKDRDGNGNDGFSSYFTTGEDTAGYLSFTPKNNATGVSLTDDLTVRFSEKMINYDGTAIANSDLSGIINLRKGTSASGSRVPFTASIDSAKRIITIDPDARLEEGTRYYLAVNSRTLKTYSGSDTISAQSITFTTTGNEGSGYCTFAPKNGAADVSGSIRPTLTFTEKMVCYDRWDITANDIYSNILSFRNVTQNQEVPYTATINSARTQITINPKASLPEACKYTLTLRSRSLRTAANYDAVPEMSVAWTTAGTQPVANLTAAANENTITVSASGTLAGTIYAVLLPDNAAVPTANQIVSGKDANGYPALKFSNAAVAANNAKEIGRYTDLTAKTTYKVCAVLIPSSSSSSSSPVVYKTVVTADKPGAKLSSLSISYDGKPVQSIDLLPSTVEYTVKVPFGTSKVTITANTPGGNTKISNSALINGPAAYEVVLTGSTNSFLIISNASGLYDTTYTLNIKVAGDTSLQSVVAGGQVLAASSAGSSGDSGSSAISYSYEIPASTDAADIIITATDPSASVLSGLMGRGSLKLSVSLAQTISFTVSSNTDTQTYTLLITKATTPMPPAAPTNPSTSPNPNPNPGTNPDPGTSLNPDPSTKP